MKREPFVRKHFRKLRARKALAHELRSMSIHEAENQVKAPISPNALLYRPCCSNCGERLWLARIKPAGRGYFLHAFECSKCLNVEELILSDGTETTLRAAQPNSPFVVTRSSRERQRPRFLLYEIVLIALAGTAFQGGTIEYRQPSPRVSD